MDGTEAGMHSPGKLIEHPDKFASELGRHDANLRGGIRSETIAPVYRIALTASSVVSTTLAMKLELTTAGFWVPAWRHRGDRDRQLVVPRRRRIHATASRARVRK